MGRKGREQGDLDLQKRRTIAAASVSVDSFVEAVADVADRDRLVEAFRQASRDAGFTHVIYYQILRNFERLSLDQGERIAASQRRAHPEIKAFDFEPWVAERLGNMQPFTWSDLPVADDLAPETRGLMSDYRREGIEDALTIPVSLRAGDLAAFVLSARNARFDVAPAALLKLQLICFALHSRYDALTPADPHRQLSRRELDVMKLAAIGKTNAEIARELGVSVHTVNTLIRRSYVKLGATNRVEASIKLAYIARRSSDD